MGMTEDHPHSALTGRIIGAAIEVHKELGPGLLESTYEQCLAHSLGSRGLSVRTQVLLPLRFQSLFIPNAYRIDMLVEDRIVVEVKAGDIVTPAHFAQVLTYLKLTGYELGLLINFNEALIKNGIKRIINSRK
jgi:GxxExxY protein